MEKNKISDHQLFALTALTSLGGSVLVISTPVAGVAKQDGWISALIAAIFGLLMVWMFCYLSSQYPGLTFIGLMKRILGKWVGSVVGIGFVFFCLHTAATVPWYISSYATFTMHETPQSVPLAVVIIAIVVALLYGIEVMGRISELFWLFFTVMFFGAILFLLPHIKLENVQPILENGIVPVLKGSVLISNFTVFHLVNLMMVYPINIDDTHQAKKAMLKGSLWANFVVFISILMSILVLGSAITAHLTYPTLVLFKEITIGDVLTSLEHVISIIWLLSEFVITTSLAYSGTLALSELLGITDYKRIVIPMGLVIGALVLVMSPNAIYQAAFISTQWPPFSITFGFVLPILLLLVYLIKKAVFKKT